METTIDFLTKATSEEIMSRIQRGENASLRSIIDDEIRKLLVRVARDAGWTEWPTKQHNTASSAHN